MDCGEQLLLQGLTPLYSGCCNQLAADPLCSHSAGGQVDRLVVDSGLRMSSNFAENTCEELLKDLKVPRQPTADTCAVMLHCMQLAVPHGHLAVLHWLQHVTWLCCIGCNTSLGYAALVATRHLAVLQAGNAISEGTANTILSRAIPILSNMPNVIVLPEPSNGHKVTVVG